MQYVKTIFPLLILFPALLLADALSRPTLESATMPADTPAKLLGWWLADPADPLSVADWSGLGNDAAIRTPQHVTTEAGTLLFDGQRSDLGALVTINSLAETQLDTGFALSLWLLSDTAATSAYIAGRATDIDMLGGFILYLDDNGTPTAYFGGNHPLVANEPLAKGVWTHLCLSHDGITASLYANGRATTLSAPFADAPAPLLLGAPPDDTLPPWRGAIADIRLYAGPLAPDEVAAIINDWPSSRHAAPYNISTSPPQVVPSPTPSSRLRNTTPDQTTSPATPPPAPAVHDAVKPAPPAPDTTNRINLRILTPMER